MASKTKGLVTGEGVVVIGLGRFGSEVARSLERIGNEVLAIDEDPEVVQHWAERLTYVVQADSTDDTSLRQVGVPEIGQVVVGIGSNVEASVLTVLTLIEMGVPNIWARASSDKHARILATIGAHHVIYPEAVIAERIAHLVTSRVLDIIEFEDDFAMAKTRVPPDVAGRTLADTEFRSRYGVTVVGVKRPGDVFEYGSRETLIPADAMLIVAGDAEQIRRFAAET
ncbi:MAG TPA: TrkA family potassium uptake protein [Micromonosporaceae bacterium]